MDCHKNEKIKWRTLDYNGPAFAPPYNPINVAIRYKGDPIKLSPEAEEYVFSYIKNRRKAENVAVYDENFFKDWTKYMNSKEKKIIRSLKHCNFAALEYAIKKQKENMQREMDIEKANHRYCVIDGLREKIKNPMVEPPGVFVGEGNHPLNGRIKRRILPEEVTVNSQKECKPSWKGHTFRKIIQNKKVLYLACWKDPLSHKLKYIQLHSSSSQQGLRDKRKFEISRRLCQKLQLVRQCYEYDLLNGNEEVSQMALALFLIDKFCLRPGYPKTPGLTAETKGCCTLTKSEMRLYRSEESFYLKLNFLGKSSVEFVKEKPISRQVYKKMKKLLSEKEDDDKVFNLIKASRLNKYLQRLCRDEDISLKSIRTHHASVILEKDLELQEIGHNTKTKMIKRYNKALAKVARLCNHKTWTTAKVNYTDPRITVAWCRKWKIPVKEIYTPFQINKFKWAIDSNKKHFKFEKQDT